MVNVPQYEMVKKRFEELEKYVFELPTGNRIEMKIPVKTLKTTVPTTNQYRMSAYATYNVAEVNNTFYDKVSGEQMNCKVSGFTMTASGMGPSMLQQNCNYSFGNDILKLLNDSTRSNCINLNLNLSMTLSKINVLESGSQRGYLGQTLNYKKIPVILSGNTWKFDSSNTETFDLGLTNSKDMGDNRECIYSIAVTDLKLRA